MRRIYLSEHTQPIFLRALNLLGGRAISYHTAEYWIAVRRDEYLSALVVLKNHGIQADLRAD